MTNKLISKSVGITIALLLVVSVAYLLAHVEIALGQSQIYTYMYVDNFGVVQDIKAHSATEAMINAINIHPNSGVLLVNETRDMNLEGEVVAVSYTGNGDFGTGGSVNNLYFYVDVNGDIRSVVADTPEEAIAIAPNIAPNSGVKRADIFS